MCVYARVASRHGFLADADHARDLALGAPARRGVEEDDLRDITLCYSLLLSYKLKIIIIIMVIVVVIILIAIVKVIVIVIIIIIII